MAPLFFAVGMTIGGKSQAQTALHIGDTIPQTLWNLPLQVVNAPGGKDEITLNDYKGKLIILDFWSTSCGTCVQKMPQIAALNQSYKGRAVIVPVSYEAGQRVRHFMQANALMKPLQLPSVVQDSLLAKYFPHYYLPHEVWIGPNGKVWAITESEYLQAENMAKALQATGHFALPAKRDVLTFDRSQPLLPQNTGPYGQVMPYRPGMRYTAVAMRDSAAGTQRFTVVNAPILQLYTLALQSQGLPLNPKRRILEVADSQDYVYNGSQGYHSQWRQQHAWCYEGVLPLAAGAAGRKQQMRQALDAYFGLHGRIQERWVSCWVLRPDNGAGRPATEIGGEPTTVGAWVRRVNQDARLPYLINESHNGQQKIGMPPLAAPFKEQAAALAAQGLQLRQERRLLPMFVLGPATSAQAPTAK